MPICPRRNNLIKLCQTPMVTLYDLNLNVFLPVRPRRERDES